MKYKRDVALLLDGTRLDFVPNDKGGLVNSYIRIEDKDGEYVGSIEGRVALKKVHKWSGEMLKVKRLKKT